MAKSVMSLKSHLKQSPFFAASMETALLSVCLFPVATEMSLELASISLVKSVQALFSGVVFCSAFVFPVVYWNG